MPVIKEGGGSKEPPPICCTCPLQDVQIGDDGVDFGFGFGLCAVEIRGGVHGGTGFEVEFDFGFGARRAHGDFAAVRQEELEHVAGGRHSLS